MVLLPCPALQIKAHPWAKVFSKRMPQDAVDLVRWARCAVLCCPCYVELCVLGSLARIGPTSFSGDREVSFEATLMLHPALRGPDCAQIGKLLVYSPTKRVTALEGMAHPFFDELRDPTCRLPNGADGQAGWPGALVSFLLCTQGIRLPCACINRADPRGPCRPVAAAAVQLDPRRAGQGAGRAPAVSCASWEG